ncbi:sensor histidine kinase [Aggregatilinea lenta]|uniref:sensor histidine kinase n=1 Tax=Aggregatilinea lenta TaxID=913108 RepID=UPI000E5BAFD6|nr:ATP-binding protein [Aggregatilinea lenta]
MYLYNFDRLGQVNGPVSKAFGIFKTSAVEWLTPRAVDRDEAFRERFLRAVLALLVSLTVASLIVSGVVFHDEWRLLSFPTLHLFFLASCYLIGLAVVKNRLVLAGWLMVLLAMAGACGVIILSRQNGSVAGAFLGPPIFLMVPIVAALVLPQDRIILLAVLSIAMYSLFQFVLPVSDFEVEGLSPQFMIVPVMLVLVFEGFLLRRLRREFDDRLAEMQKSMTEIEHAKQQAEAARLRAEEADSAKSQFLANVSHELRTPLNAIIGYDEAMLAGMVGEFTPQQIKLLGIMQHSSRRLLTLINDILDLSKIEAGSMAVYLTKLDPARTVRETVDSLCGLAEEKAIYVRTFFDESTPATILSDKNKLEQIIVNLLSNAIKFTEHGGVTIKVSGEADKTLVIEITDTGIGIPDDAQSSIFDPFRQVDGSLKRKYSGTGLGLSITKRLVEALEGTISIKSQVGIGSTFTVVLPGLRDSTDLVSTNGHTNRP